MTEGKEEAGAMKTGVSQWIRRLGLAAGAGLVVYHGTWILSLAAPYDSRVWVGLGAALLGFFMPAIGTGD